MTQLISQRFYQFFHLFPIYPHLPKVLALCPEGEHHQVGLLLFSLFMRKMERKSCISEPIRLKKGISNSPRAEHQTGLSFDYKPWTY